MKALAAAGALACAQPLAAQYTAMLDAVVDPTATSYYATQVTVPVEPNYIPNVVWRENGAAHYEALKVQAVAARGYLYYKFSTTPNGGKATAIRDGTQDQVYSKSGTAPITRATASSGQLKYFDATDDTEREILIVTTSTIEPQATFYVAGGRPDTSGDASTYWPLGAPLGQWEEGDQLPTNTERWVTYNRGMTGSNVTPTPLGHTGNPVNRGAKSQNGAHFLASGRSNMPGHNFAAWNYVDILKYYYGQSAQLMMAKSPTGALPANQKVLVDFEVDEGYLRNRMDFSSSNQFIVYSQSNKFRDTSVPQAGSASQRIIIKYDSTADTTNQGFTFRNMSGMVMGTEANPTMNDNLIGTTVSNIIIEPRGSIGFWIRTTTSGLTVQPLLDQGATSTVKGLLRNIIPDGTWRKYEWFLTDNPQWSAFSGSKSVVDSAWTMDSLMLFGKSDATLNLDTVFYDGRTTPPTNQWYYDWNGSYNFAGNWVSSVPNATNAVANFLGHTTARRTISVDSNVTVGTINLNNTVGYTITGPAAISMSSSSGTAQINVQSTGIHIIQAQLNLSSAIDVDLIAGANLDLGGTLNNAVNPLVGRSIRKTGAGHLAITGAQNHAQGAVFNADEGLTTITTNAGGAAKATQLTVNVNSRVNFLATQHLAALNIADGGIATVAAGGNSYIHTRSLSILGSGKLDLRDNDLVVDYSGSSPYSTLLQYVLDGYSDVPDNSKSGIVSTTSQNRGGDTILVLLDNAMIGGALTEWPPGSGNSINATTIIGKYTYFGDVNLDGQVTGDDFALVVSNLGMAQNAHWVFGDMNFDGLVTGDDIAIVVANLGKGVGNPLGYAELSGASIPEPGAGVLLGLALLGLARRRRRNRPSTS